MNKLYKRIIAAVSAIMLAVSASTAYAAIPKDAIEELENYYNGSDPSVKFDPENKPALYATLWYEHSDLSEEIPEECYDYINDALKDQITAEYPNLSNNWYVEATNVTYDDGAVSFSVKSITEYPVYDVYRQEIFVAVLDKDTGDVVRVGSPTILSETSTYHEMNNGEDLTTSINNKPLTVEQAHDKMFSYMDPSDCHFSKCSELSLKAELPQVFDSAKHVLVLTPVLLFNIDYTESQLPGKLGAEFYTPYEIDANIPETVYAAGDANADGVVNLTDASLMMKHIAVWSDLTIDVGLADMNDDGAVNLTDVSLVMKHIAGWTV